MTIYDIAKEAGVSASTVSRVVNGKPGTKEKTRQKVQKLLDQYGYTPNETARGLVNRSSRMIGILIVDIRDAHHVEIAYNMEIELRKAGYCSLIFNTGLTEDKKVEAIRLLEQRRVDGAILIGSAFQTGQVKEALAASIPGIPIIMTNGYLDLPNVRGILVDEKEGIENCVYYLHGRGHRKLAFVLSTPTPSNLSKQQGFINGMLNAGYKKEDLWLYKRESSLKHGYDFTLELLKEHPDIEGIIFCEDLSAAGAIHALTDSGKNIPGEVAVVGVDNSLYGEVCRPTLTSLNNMATDMSKEAAKILLASLAGENCRAKVMLCSGIVERESS